ncbi:MAG: DUF4369 domain-containing protein [Akkermansiaceae bacterium]|nr:DUF4369 domain-containing protein [Akkermansiaceae bacterium]
MPTGIIRTRRRSVPSAASTAFGHELGKAAGTDRASRGKTVGALDWRCTTRPGRIYLHLLKWPAGKFELTGMKGKPAKVYLLADPAKKALEFALEDGTFSVMLPDHAPDPRVSVLCVELE